MQSQNEKLIQGRCIVCKKEGSVYQRVVGAGIEIEVCPGCSHAGQQAMAVGRTLKPFFQAARPYLERAVDGLLSELAKRVAR